MHTAGCLSSVLVKYDGTHASASDLIDHTNVLLPDVCLHQQWGVAYELAGNPAQQAQTLKYLEWREKQVSCFDTGVRLLCPFKHA